MNEKYEIAIIGGGASGLFALRGFKDRKTIVIESDNKLGAKLLITGGSKCNFTNRNVSFNNFISSNPHFIKSALSKFGSQDIIALINNHKIKFEERDNGKLFTLDGADKILAMLLKDGESRKLSFKMGAVVTKVLKNDDFFTIYTKNGLIEAEKVVVASGGLSYPVLGATGIAYKIAENFGMTVVKTTPALTSLRYPVEISKEFAALSGIAINASIKINKKIITDNLLFTHHGFSGPLALNASLYCDDKTEVVIDFAPDLDVYKYINENRTSKKSIATLLSYHIPKSLVKALLGDVEYDIAHIKKAEVENLHKLIKEKRFLLTDPDGYNKAEVTSGGVSVDDIFPTTMESRKCAGLYFIGESLDITGELGGYNLHWAWASANALINGFCKKDK